MAALFARTALRRISATLAASIALAQLAPSAALAQAAAGKKPSLATATDEQRAAARQHYAEAEARFTAGDFAAAYTEYKAANDILPAPQTLWKMAQSLDKQGDAPGAVAAYQAFLGAGPPASMAERVQTANQRIAALQSQLPGKVDLATDPPGATVSVDGKPAPGTTPVTLSLPAGQHRIVVSLSGWEDTSTTVDSVAGTSQSLKLPLKRPPAPVAVAPAVVAPPVAAAPPPVIAAPPAPAEPVAPPKPAPKRAAKPAPVDVDRTPYTSYALFGGAAVGAVVGGVFGLKALGDKHDFDGGTKTTAQADATSRDALIADVGFGAAIVLGVAGALLWDTKPSDSERASVRVTPLVGPSGAGASASVRF